MISRPKMVCVMKENTKGLTHMNKQQMWKSIEEKGLTDKAFEIEKNRERRPCMRSMVVIDFETDEKLFFLRMWEAVKYYGKCYTFFIYNNAKVWENKKINVIDN